MVKVRGLHSGWNSRMAKRDWPSDWEDRRRGLLGGEYREIWKWSGRRLLDLRTHRSNDHQLSEMCGVYQAGRVVSEVGGINHATFGSWTVKVQWRAISIIV